MNAKNTTFNEMDFLDFIKSKLDAKKEQFWHVKYFILHFMIVAFIRFIMFGLLCLFTNQTFNITFPEFIQATNTTILWSLIAFVAIGISFSFYQNVDSDFYKECVTEYAKQHDVDYEDVNQYAANLFNACLKNKHKSKITELSYMDLNWLIKQQKV